MWVSVTLIYFVPAVVITIQLLSPPRKCYRGPVRGTALRAPHAAGPQAS